MEQKTVLLTGGGSGIGEGVAHVLSSRGWRVIVNDVNADAAKAVAKAVSGTPLWGDVRANPADMVAKAVEIGGGLHGLVNNAGIVRRSHLAETTEADLDLVYEINLKAMIRLSQAALPHLKTTGGSVVNVSSTSAEHPKSGAGFYSMAKAGASSFTKLAALEWGPSGVRVNAVAPGLIRTAMSEAVYSNPETKARREAVVPLRRIGTPTDVGKVVAFLLSDDAAYVSGQVIDVDGGFNRTLLDNLPNAPVPSAAE